eukprot:c19634_g1_i2.p1 GENE.c19634_g1_i2~~c19634_g1_i2.p1  ORF type:complete len:243 (-),score=44.89 c19634_g1_i2:599-1327(-)
MGCGERGVRTRVARGRVQRRCQSVQTVPPRAARPFGEPIIDTLNTCRFEIQLCPNQPTTKNQIPFDMYETLLALQHAYNNGTLSPPLDADWAHDSSELSPAAAARDLYVRALALQICQLPPLSQRLVRRLLLLLNTVHCNARVNHMQASLLAEYFAPEVLRARRETLESVVTDLPVTVQLLAFMILNYDGIEDLLGNWDTEGHPPGAVDRAEPKNKSSKGKLEKESSWKSKLGLMRRSSGKD